MKKIFLLVMLLGFTLWGWSAEKNIINVWSGVEQVLPFSGDWRLNASHGRQIASGVGQVKLNIPNLEADTALEADLVVNNVTTHLKIWSRKLLDISRWQFNESGKKLKELFTQYAIDITPKRDSAPMPLLISDNVKFEAGKTTICIISEKKFPFRVDFSWTELTCGMIDNNDGNLGIDALQNGEMVNLRGKWSYIELKNQDTKMFIISPKVDFSTPDAVLWLRNIANLIEKKTNEVHELQ